ncbi:MAG: metal ABC transporter permease, partial [Hyphomicrobiales bacterium]
MLDSFFAQALVAGVGIAITAGPFGCVIVWRRMAFFGDTMAHAALLGVALSFLLDINISLAVFAVALFTAASLGFLQKRGTLPADTILGILAHSTLALGLV